MCAYALISVCGRRKQPWDSSSVVESVAWASSCNPSNIFCLENLRLLPLSVLFLLNLATTSNPLVLLLHQKYLWSETLQVIVEMLVRMAMRRAFSTSFSKANVLLHCVLQNHFTDIFDFFFPVFISMLACVNAFEYINIWVFLQVKNMLRIAMWMRKLPSKV